MNEQKRFINLICMCQRRHSFNIRVIRFNVRYIKWLYLEPSKANGTSVRQIGRAPYCNIDDKAEIEFSQEA